MLVVPRLFPALPYFRTSPQGSRIAGEGRSSSKGQLKSVQGMWGCLGLRTIHNGLDMIASNAYHSHQQVLKQLPSWKAWIWGAALAEDLPHSSDCSVGLHSLAQSLMPSEANPILQTQINCLTAFPRFSREVIALKHGIFNQDVLKSLQHLGWSSLVPSHMDELRWSKQTQVLCPLEAYQSICSQFLALLQQSLCSSDSTDRNYLRR